MRLHLDSFISSHRVVRGLLRGFSIAQQEIFADFEDPEDAGTTTLVGGVVLPLVSDTANSVEIPSPKEPKSPLDQFEIQEKDTQVPEDEQNAILFSSQEQELEREPSPVKKWAAILATVGDCKAFLWRVGKGEVVEITEGNRHNSRDVRDCGGRLGPAQENCEPDLRNFFTSFCVCEEGDLLMLMSDGVHDNLDPENLGYLPCDLPPHIYQDLTSLPDLAKLSDPQDEAKEEEEEINLKEEIAEVDEEQNAAMKAKELQKMIVESRDWDILPNDLTGVLKTAYRKHFLLELLDPTRQCVLDLLSPDQVVETLLRHCVSTTQKAESRWN